MRSIFIFAIGLLGSFRICSHVTCLIPKRYIELTTELKNTRDAKKHEKISKRANFEVAGKKKTKNYETSAKL